MIKELMKSIREYKRDSILTPILVSLEVVMECIIPFVVAQLVNEIKAGSGMSVISRYGLILVVMALMSLAFGAGAGSVCASASCGFAKNLRKDMFYRIQDFSFENIDKFSTSSLVTRMTTDVMNVQLAFMMLIRLAIRSPLMLIFSFTMAFIMGGKMALIFLVVIPILGIGLFAVIHKVGPLFKRVFRKYDALNNSIQENVKGMRVVKSFVREEYEKEKFHHAAEEVCQDFTRAEKILAINSPLMQFCLYVVMIFVLSFGSYTIITSGGLDLDVGQFSALLVYSFQILNSLMMFSMVFVMVTMAAESAQRIVEVLKEDSTLTSPADPVECIHTAGQLSQLFQNGEIGIFFYPVVTVYHFKINSGRIFNSGVDRRAVSAVFLMDRLYDRRIFCRIFVCDFGGVILRTVVDNQNFNILSPRKQRFDAMCHIILRIIAGNCNRKQFHSVVPFIFWIPV